MVPRGELESLSRGHGDEGGRKAFSAQEGRAIVGTQARTGTTCGNAEQEQALRLKYGYADIPEVLGT